MTGDENYDDEDDEYNARARKKDPETSHMAAARMGDCRGIDALIVRALRLYGRFSPMSCAQVHSYYPDISVDCFSPRFCKLVERGIIRQLDKQPRPNRHGKTRKQLVYEMND